MVVCVVLWYLGLPFNNSHSIYVDYFVDHDR